MTQVPKIINDALIVRPGEGLFYQIQEPGWAAPKTFVRVTHPLSYWVPPQLKNWFIKTPTEEIESRKESTASQGTAIHKKAERGEEDRLTEILNDLGAKIVAQEIVVWSRNGWAGSVDLVVEIDGALHVLDIKTGRFGQVWYQLGAYALACKELGLDIQGAGAVSLPRDESKPGRYYDYSKNLEGGELAYCQLFDFWKRSNYKDLKDWEFFEPFATFSYCWSPEVTNRGEKNEIKN